jgi:hypothetical protein
MVQPINATNNIGSLDFTASKRRAQVPNIIPKINMFLYISTLLLSKISEPQ